MKKESLSVIIPVYGAGKKLEELTKDILVITKSAFNSVEIILVNDGCPYNTQSIITSLVDRHHEVKAILLSRNFGQHAAILAGLNHCQGDVNVVMDCDYQDNPIYIDKLYEKVLKGADIVFTVKHKRKHSLIKNLLTWFFNVAFNYLSDNKSHGNIGNYSMITKKVVKSFVDYKDYQFHYLMVLRWLGYRQDSIKIDHLEREEGKSSYNLSRLINHALVAITYSSDKLLFLSIYSGAVISIGAILFGIILVIKYFFYRVPAGWTSVAVLILLSLGITQISFGIIGLYLGKVFQQVKNRPRFIVSEVLQKKLSENEN